MVDAYDWLHELYMHEYLDYIKIRTLLPEEIWKRYDLFEVEGLREQELLAEVSNNLCRAWRKKRPQLFNKDKKRKLEDD